MDGDRISTAAEREERMQRERNDREERELKREQKKAAKKAEVTDRACSFVRANPSSSLANGVRNTGSIINIAVLA